MCIRDRLHHGGQLEQRAERVALQHGGLERARRVFRVLLQQETPVAVKFLPFGAEALPHPVEGFLDQALVYDLVRETRQIVQEVGGVQTGVLGKMCIRDRYRSDDLALLDRRFPAPARKMPLDME